MKNLKIKKILFIGICLIIFPCICFAEDIYISQTTQGSNTGVNCANAHSIAWFNTSGNWGDGVNKISAGDTAHFCGTLTSTATVQGSGTTGNVITLLFESGAKFSKPYWSTSGAITATSKSYIIIDGNVDGIIENTDNGSVLTNQQSTAAMVLNSCSNLEIKNLTIRNMYVHPYMTIVADPATLHGIYALNCNDISVHDNDFTEGYFSVEVNNTSGGTKSNISIYKNNVSKMCHGIIVAGGNSGSITDNVSVYSNNIEMGVNWNTASNACHPNGTFTYSGPDNVWGLTNAKYYNNYVYEPSGSDVSNSCTSFMGFEGLTNVSSLKIYNNVLVMNGKITACGNGLIRLDDTDSFPEVYNNTLIGYSTGSTAGIHYRSISGNGHPVIKNNIISTLAYAYFGSTTGDFPVADNNIYYNIGGGIGYVNKTIFGAITNWRTALGGCPNAENDCNSITDNPNLDASYKPTSSSAIIFGTAKVLNDKFTIDKNGTTRGTTWDIGSYEYIDANLPHISILP